MGSTHYSIYVFGGGGLFLIIISNNMYLIPICFAVL
jgi:hypothetical protein